MAFDLAAAIADGVGVSEKALTVPNVRVWPVSEINFYPGVMLTADAGFVVARAGADASFRFKRDLCPKVTT